MRLNFEEMFMKEYLFCSDLSDTLQILPPCCIKAQTEQNSTKDRENSKHYEGTRYHHYSTVESPKYAPPSTVPTKMIWAWRTGKKSCGFASQKIFGRYRVQGLHLIRDWSILLESRAVVIVYRRYRRQCPSAWVPEYILWLPHCIHGRINFHAAFNLVDSFGDALVGDALAVQLENEWFP